MDIPSKPLAKDYIYKEASERKLELTFLSPLINKFDKAPLLFLIPGGGWHYAKRQSMIDAVPVFVESLRKEGFAVASVDYRVCADNAKMHDMITDCFDALRYLSYYAQVFGIDKHNILTLGHSAGAHLALMCAYAPKEKFADSFAFDEDFTVRGVVALSPATVLDDKSYHGLSNIDDAFDGETKFDDMRKCQPITYVTECCPPTLIATGSLDNLIYPKSSQLLHSMLTEKKVYSKLVVSEGGGHIYEQIDQNTPPSLDILDIQQECIAFVLKLFEVGDITL